MHDARVSYLIFPPFIPQFIGKKAAYALGQNLKVIACVGEKLEEREAGKTFDVCFEQLKAFAGNIIHSCLMQ